MKGGGGGNVRLRVGGLTELAGGREAKVKRLPADKKSGKMKRGSGGGGCQV